MKFDKLKEIFLLVTTQCNWNCQHCYLSHNDKMSVDLVDEIIDALGNKYKITIIGGEILTDLQYLRFFPKIGQNYILTNGLELYKNPSTYDLLKEFGINTIALSYYFDYDKFFCGVPREKVEEVIKESKKRGFAVSLNTVIGEFNYFDILNMSNKAVELGVDSLKLLNYVNMGKGANHKDYLLPKQHINIFFSELQKARMQYNGKITIKYHRSFGACPNSDEEIMQKNNRLCWAGKEYIVIDSLGKIYSCPFVMGTGLEIGKYEKGKLIKLCGLMENNRKECIAYYYN